MMRIKLCLIACLLFITTSSLFAHAVWIETNPIAQKGIKHEVKIFFGEYGDNERDTVAKWFSDLKEIKLWLVAPDGTKSQLATSNAIDRLSATFMPQADGVYTLLIFHVVKDLHGKSKIEYNASATVTLGKQPNSAAFNTNEVGIFSTSGGTAKLHQPFTLQSFYKGQPAAKQKLDIVSPGGWEKKLTGNDDGAVTVTPIVPGIYMAEAMINVKEPGEHNGKPYEGTWKIATYCITAGK